MTQIKVELQGTFGTDRDIANAAWTSSTEHQKKKARTDKDIVRVVNMLADLKHSVPFESIIFRFWIKMPIQTDRQFMTHRLQCLSGHNLLYFDLPKTGNQKYKLFKMSIKDFVNKWENGVLSKNRWGSIGFKKHKNRLSKMRLRSVNENTGEIYHTSVNNIFKNGTQPIFEFEFKNGYKIKSTLNHKYLTDKGWLTIGESLGLLNSLTSTPSIFKNDRLFSVNGKLAYKDFNYLKNLKDKGFSVTEMSVDLGVSYHTVRKWLKIHKLSFNQQDFYFKKGIVPWNKGLTYKHNKPYNISFETRQLKKERASGFNSNFWKGGITSELSKLRRECTEKLSKVAFKRDNFKCICGSKEKLNAHHIIPIYADNTKIMDINNLITLCESCHKYIHSNHLEEKFAEERDIIFNKVKPKGKGKKLVRDFVKIKNVKFIGYEDTYDIEVKGPFHNFICNGVVVHNSASGMSARYRTMPSEFLEIPQDIKLILKKKSTFNYIEDQYYDLCNESNNWYKEILQYLKECEKINVISNEEYKRCREFFRGVLPQNNMTERVTTINLRSFANFIKLRNSLHAQPEIQEVARQMLEAVKASNVCPIAIEALERNQWSI